MKILKILFIIFFIGLFPSISFSSDKDKADNKINSMDWRNQQEIWWSNDNIIKDTVLSVLAIKNKHLKLGKNEDEAEYADLLNDIGYLLLLFDSMNSERSLSTLASFLPYNIGESGSEIYHCLLIRKGKKIKPYLIRISQISNDECIEKFGKKSSICKNNLSTQMINQEIGNIIESIDKNNSCTIEK